VLAAGNQNWVLHHSLWTSESADSPAIELSPADSVVAPNTGTGIFAHQRIPARIWTGGFTELGELATRRAKRDQYEKRHRIHSRSERKLFATVLAPTSETVRERNSRIARSRATINKAHEVRGNTNRVARRVISWRAIRSEGRGSGGFPWINPWTLHKSPAVSLLFSPIYIFACRWALIHSRSARRDVIPCPI